MKKSGTALQCFGGWLVQHQYCFQSPGGHEDLGNQLLGRRALSEEEGEAQTSQCCRRLA